MKILKINNLGIYNLDEMMKHKGDYNEKNCNFS